MAENVRAFPLQWPLGYPRTPADYRKSPKFNNKRVETRRFSPESKPYSYTVTSEITVEVARKRLQDELDRIGAALAVLSTNLELRLDGLPRSGQKEPDDPGVALYFHLKGRAICLPCDRYTTVAGNIAAIAAHIEATRAIERHGIATVEEMFSGFTAIRGPGPKPWREVLGIKLEQRVTRELIRARRRELAAQHHPDMGGSEVIMQEINAAADRAMEEIDG